MALCNARMNPLPVIIAVDVDPDWRVSGTSGKPYSGEMSWRGVREGIPRLLRHCASLRDTWGAQVRFTWLLRSDEQMAATTGNPAFLADEFEDLWRSRIIMGDEIGWHPHAWRLSEKEGIWYQEMTDVDWIRNCFREGYRALARHFQIRTAKPGWTCHSTLTMNLFAELGVKVDLSALPGMARKALIYGTNLPLDSYDWKRAPSFPYHPSGKDFQSPGNTDALPILEVPNRTFSVGFVRFVKHSVTGRSRLDVANPVKLPILVRRSFSNPGSAPFVCYFHPEELLGPNSLFGADFFPANISRLIAACHKRGVAPKMIRAMDILSGEVT